MGNFIQVPVPHIITAVIS